MIVIGDVHGCYKTLVALLENLPDDEVCFVGDLIDRGPSSPQVVELVKSNGYNCVIANHEDMALDEIRVSRHYDDGIWLYNGGIETVEQYKKAPDHWLKEHFDWFLSLPKYIEFPDVVDDQGRSLFVSHSSVYPYGPIDVYDLEMVSNAVGPGASHTAINKSIFWHRGTPARLKSQFHVFGHTPIRKPLVTDYYANIDTGCVYNRGGYKYLTAIQYPSMMIFQQENIDTEYKHRKY